MAPFNHFGAVFSTPLPPVSPPSTKRGVREQRAERRALRDFQPERAPNTSRDSKLRRGRRLSPRQEPAVVDSDSASTGEVSSASDSGSAPAATERGILGDAIAGVGSAVDSAAGAISGSNSDNAPAATERGILGDAIAGVSSVIDSALDPILGGGQSSTAVAAPEKTNAAEVESKSTPVATTASEPEAGAITSNKPSPDAVKTSRPAIITTTPTEHTSKSPDAPASSAPPVVAVAGTTGVLSPEAAATPTPSNAGQLTRFNPEFTMAFPTPTAQLQSADRVSLGNSQATGAAGQKAQGQAVDSIVSSDPGSDSDSDDGIDSGVESDDDLDSDDEDNATESRLVAFTTISGTPLSTLSAVLDPTAVRNLPSSVTPVSQTGGQTTIASAAANNKPSPLTPEASNGLIAFGAVGGVLLLSFVVYILLRLRKTDAFGCFSCCGSKRKSQSNASKSLYHASGVFGTAAPSETQTHSRGFSVFFNPMIRLRAAEYEKDPSQGQPYSRNSLIQNAAPIAVSQQPMPSRDEPPPMPILPPAYRQANANNTRMSEVSSLSSGFGDAVIDIPESGPTTTYLSNKSAQGLPKPNNQTLGLDLGPRFSWANVPTPRTLGTHRNRDTTNSATTTASRDSEPRFRTVTSWVNQQTNRVMKNQGDSGASTVSSQERSSVPDVPAVPEAYGGGKHQRMPSATPMWCSGRIRGMKLRLRRVPGSRARC
ncbi:hypothetical protein VE04_07117 [Pseudogymnoascus sp. 24MN13]|nr:hypothetical protein VE04_07117 [Pseudogymnoascus sp. 24MN13]